MTADSTTGASMRPAVYLALLAQVLISAGTYLAAKRGMQEVSPFTLVIWRFLLSGSAYLVLLAFLPEGRRWPPPGTRLKILVLGLLAGPVNQGLFFAGLNHSSAAHAALLYALTPTGVYLLSLSRGRERVSGRAAIGLAIALGGVAVLLLGGGLLEARGTMGGDLLILGAVAAWAYYTTELRPVTTEHGPIRVTAWTMGAAALLSVPAMPFFIDLEGIARGTPTLWGALLFLGLLTSVVSYFLWSYALSHAAASKVAVFANLQPPATAIAAWALLGEPITIAVVLGGSLVLAGVRLTQTAKLEA